MSGETWGRRAFLGAGGLAFASLLTACGDVPSVVPSSAGLAGSATPSPIGTSLVTRPDVAAAPEDASTIAAFGSTWTRTPAPFEAFTALPGKGGLLAWTVDDGADSSVIRAYAEFAAVTGTRLTLFVTASYPGWADNVDILKPLVARGQVQLGNHTWSHPDLTSLSENRIRDELQRAHDRIGELFGVDARPFYRPPYGFHSGRVRAAAASIGYTAPTLWYGTLADSGLIPAEEILRLGGEWFLPQHIVIGHLNHAPVTTVLPQLAAIIAERRLTTVTLNHVFSSPQHP
ncbi:polysaccharide deacetylase family protein [Microbacterium sp. Au-Mic1]|uniref:polysaccharide deacetylase family protein n=1 Tax=Microbacterium sp. Au-Mic1 TaxID=2906457 RepID=UPI001E30947C|nr:polysaccharide deacetylase family protein [Microbacterium sp. Au-Mic1]MCE4025974.1 polysaccharide deacetylase family protein [Microbacterium sp. Au-Mic1]